MTRVSRSVREQVKQRALERCEYCRTPEEFRLHSFQVEHIRPVKHGGLSHLDNLAWACLHCNLRKGTDLTAYDDLTGEIALLFNPRTQNWNDHFELDTGLVVGKSPTGRATVQLLQFNHPDQIETRLALISAHRWE